MITLREYQTRSINMLYTWFEQHPEGNPCLVLPTGSGKSIIIAELCRDAVQNWPETRILVLSHVKELLEQDANKILAVWPEAPVGIYSASIGMKRLSEPITVAGIQSIRKRASEVGHTDLIIVDEAHLISHKDEGGYRSFIAELSGVNPALRVIGLTATPYRLGHGLITDKPAIFDDLIEPVSIEELVAHGYLCQLRSKVTAAKLDVSNVHLRGGEFIEHELQAAVNAPLANEQVVEEVIRRGEDRRSWLFFCSGVDHAYAMRDALIAQRINAACVTGETPKNEREDILQRFKAGEIRAVSNANVLTTGFDHPDIDLIAMCRPTMSPGLYVQMAGRGMRPKEHIADCLMLDFAGNVERHGPITAVQPPKRGTKGTGEAPVKACEQCGELVAIAARVCPACGAAFPEPEKKKLWLHDDDIMGLDPVELEINRWKWARHIAYSSGKEMLKVTYYGGLCDSKAITEYLPLLHGGYAGEKATGMIRMMMRHAGGDIEMMHDLNALDDLDALADQLNTLPPPSRISYRMDGKYARITAREWEPKNDVVGY